MKIQPERIALIIICAIYLALACTYAVVLPPWEAPDEPAHYLYASQLAARWRPATEPAARQTTSFARDYAYISSNNEWFQPALGYLPAALVLKVLDTLAPSSLPREIPPLNPLFSQDPYHNAPLFIHADLKLLQIWKSNWGLLVLRIACALWGLVVIYAAFRIGRILDQKSAWLGLVAAGWIAFLPQFTFVNASIRSDAVANAAAALVFLLTALMYSSKARINTFALLIGLVLGLGTLCKHTFTYIIPLGLLAVIFVHPRSPRQWPVPLLCVLAPVTILVAAYYLVFPEAPLAFGYAFAFSTRMAPDALTWNYVREIPVPLLTDLFYARFGWANVTVPSTLPRLAFVIWSIGLLTGLAHLRHLFGKPETSQSLKILTLLALGWMLALAGVLRFNLAIFNPQGRLLFPVLAPWAILGFWGLAQTLRGRKKTIAGIALICFMLAFNLYALFFCLIPAYY